MNYTDLIYQATDYHWRKADRTFFNWDKGDCSQVGALLVLLKAEIEKGMKEPYYLSSYPKHEELYELLFSDETRFIS